MRIPNSTITKTLVVIVSAILCLALAPSETHARQLTAPGGTPEQRTAVYFETIRKSPPEQLAFLLEMPKGGDLHNHLSGSIYAETYVQWAADKALCVNDKTFVLSQSPCDVLADQLPANMALTNSVLYREMINAWSMRFWQYSGENGHDQFFDTFGRFSAATTGQTGAMIADTASRAARGHVLYLELMLTPDNGLSSTIGKTVGWDGNVDSTLAKLKAGGIAGAAAASVKNLVDAEAQKDKLLKCNTPQADPGCAVTIRYMMQVSRAADLGTVFAQMVTGFTLADDPKSKVVALNLVQAEDSLASMQNFTVEMQMLHSLAPKYPHAHLSLHAGELAPGLVSPDGLTFHIRESVMIAGAQRIGHGVDIMHEDQPYDLLQEMAKRNVLVEICLTSNEVILGISGIEHPLATYLQYGVPVALATDDEGVSRSEISEEFLKASQDQGLGYIQLKTLARNSLSFAFISGDSLWSDPRKFVPTSACVNDVAAMKLDSPGCKQFIAASEKAKLQWKLEEDLMAFESQY